MNDPDTAWLHPTVPEWSVGPSSPRAIENEIHLWRIPLKIPTEGIVELDAWLSPEEKERACRFRLDLHRRRYIVSHGAVRVILSRYIDVPPQQICFVRGPQGKPFLNLSSQESGIHFNLTHTGDLAVCAVASRDVGVDAEEIRSRTHEDGLFERVLSQREQDVLKSSPFTQRPALFHAFWTCKEAILKAEGVGLSRSLGSIEIQPLPDRISWMFPEQDGDASPGGSLHLFSPFPNTVGAVAASHPPCVHQFWTLWEAGATH